MKPFLKDSFRPITHLVRHSAVYAISTSVQRLQGLILLPVYTSITYISSRSEFGNYVLIYTFIAFMNLFYLYGMDSALLRYFFLGRHDRKTVFSSTFLILLSSSFVTTLFLFLLGESLSGLILKRPDLSLFIRLAALILWFDSLLNLPYLILRAEEKSVQFTLFKGLRFLMELALNIFFVVFLRLGVIGILYANLLAAIMNLGLMLPIIIRYFKPVVNFQLWQEMLRFGIPFLPNGIAYMTIEMVDRFLVQEYLGKDAVGLYGANYKFGTILLLLVVAFRNAWQPFFLRIADQPQAPKVYSRVLTYFIMGGGIVTLLVTYFIRDLLTWHVFQKFYLLGPQYWEGIPIIPFILLSYYLFGVYVILTPGFYIKKRSQFMVLFTGSGAIVNILANMILLPVLHIWGAAVATLLSYFTMTLTIYLVSQRIYPIQIEWSRVAKMFALIAVFMVLFYVAHWNIWIRLVGMSTIVGICYRLILHTEERRALKAQLAELFG